MSLEKTVNLICDECGCTAFAIAPTMTGNQIRALVGKKGWSYSSGKDLCDLCRPRRKDGEVWGHKEVYTRGNKKSRYVRPNKRKKPAT